MSLPILSVAPTVLGLNDTWTSLPPASVMSAEVASVAVTDVTALSTYATWSH